MTKSSRPSEYREAFAHQVMEAKHNRKLDMMLGAKKPGKRKSKNGNIYYEYRIGHSDYKGRI